MTLAAIIFGLVSLACGAFTPHRAEDPRKTQIAQPGFTKPGFQETLKPGGAVRDADTLRLQERR